MPDTSTARYLGASSLGDLIEDERATDTPGSDIQELEGAWI